MVLRNLPSSEFFGDAPRSRKAYKGFQRCFAPESSEILLLIKFDENN